MENIEIKSSKELEVITRKSVRLSYEHKGNTHLATAVVTQTTTDQLMNGYVHAINDYSIEFNDPGIEFTLTREEYKKLCEAAYDCFD